MVSYSPKSPSNARVPAVERTSGHGVVEPSVNEQPAWRELVEIVVKPHPPSRRAFVRHGKSRSRRPARLKQAPPRRERSGSPLHEIVTGGPSLAEDRTSLIVAPTLTDQAGRLRLELGRIGRMESPTWHLDTSSPGCCPRSSGVHLSGGTPGRGSCPGLTAAAAVFLHDAAGLWQMQGPANGWCQARHAFDWIRVRALRRVD
jgi:hypothetical protein